MDNLIKSIEYKHGLDFGFIIIGIAGFVFAVVGNTLFLYVLAMLFISFGVYVFYTTHKKIKSHQYIKQNYQTNPKECLKIIEEDIMGIKRSIAIDQRKADAGGKDSVDSADDVIRKNLRLDKFVAVKAEIEKYL